MAPPRPTAPTGVVRPQPPSTPSRRPVSRSRGGRRGAHRPPRLPARTGQRGDRLVRQRRRQQQRRGRAQQPARHRREPLRRRPRRPGRHLRRRLQQPPDPALRLEGNWVSAWGLDVTGRDEDQTVSFEEFAADDTFTLGNLPGSCSSSTTDPIIYTGSAASGRENMQEALEAKCGANNFTLSSGPAQPARRIQRGLRRNGRADDDLHHGKRLRQLLDHGRAQRRRRHRLRLRGLHRSVDLQGRRPRRL